MFWASIPETELLLYLYIYKVQYNICVCVHTHTINFTYPELVAWQPHLSLIELRTRKWAKKSSEYPKRAVPNLVSTRGWFYVRQFFYRQGWVVVSGWFKHITLIVHFISIMSAPPQIIRQEILEVGDPCPK